MQEIIFLIVWLIGVIIFLTIFINIIATLKNNNFPEKYTDVKAELGKPLESFGVSILSLNGIRVRGFNGKIEIYNNILVLKYSDRCLKITDINNIKIEKQLFWKHLIINNNGKNIVCLVDDKKIEKIYTNFNLELKGE